MHFFLCWVSFPSFLVALTLTTTLVALFRFIVSSLTALVLVSLGVSTVSVLVSLGFCVYVSGFVSCLSSYTLRPYSDTVLF